MYNYISITIKNFLVVFLFIVTLNNAYAVELDQDCQPNGFVAKGKETWNPKEFWSEQIKEIKEDVKWEKESYQLFLLQEKRDRANERFDDKEMKLMGIKPHSDPELDRMMKETDKMLRRGAYEWLQDSIKWGKKCEAYAERKLSSSK